MEVWLPQQLERWAAERLGRHLEPHVATWVREFLNAPEGRELLAAIFAEAIEDLLTPGPGRESLSELLISRLVQRMAGDRPRFRERLLQVLQATPTGEER